MKTTKAIVTCLILFMALLQGPLLYYYGSGFRLLVFMYPYMLVGFALSIYLVLKLRHKESNTPFIKIGCFVGIVLGIATMFSEDVIEYLDWKLRRGTRNEIVEQVKKGDFKSGHPSRFDFPPISNSDGGVWVQKPTDKTVTITFYINAGAFDHYSAFVYTNDVGEMKSIEGGIADGKRPGFKKLDANWYRVNY